MTTERMSEQEYLVRERAAEYRSEYGQGRMVAMTGASRSHNRITVSLARHLGNQLEDRRCEVFVADMRVKVQAAGLYAYPDVVAVCGPPEFEDAETDTLLNPTVIVEILSPSTEAYDRGEKFAYYGRLESLRELVLIAQDRMRVEHWAREGDRWAVLSDPDAILELTSLECRTALQEIYERVELPPAGDLPPRG